MNNQDRFYTAVADAIVATYDQGRQSIQDTDCLYRGPNGIKCTIGHIIEDQFYSSDMESLSPEDTPVLNAIDNSLGFEITTADVGLLLDIQSCHDELEFAPGNKEEFQIAFLCRLNEDINRYEPLVKALKEKHPEFYELMGQH